MDRIIREMLELSRLEYEASPIQAEEVSLGGAGAEIIGRYKQICEERSISVCLEGDGTVRADQYLLLRVVDNFFVNGLEHTPEGGSIYIRVLGNKFEIYNRGSHIPEDKINEIWLPYKKADTSRSNTKGTGLGLAIARTILERYKCSYGAQNMDGGVLFWFQFSEQLSLMKYV